MLKRRPRLLLVDDDPSYRALVRHSLRLQFIVYESSNGMDAIAQATDTAPEVVLLDIEMPGLSGIEILSHIRKQSRLRHLPVIMLTGDSHRDTVVKAMKAGATDYILKSALNTTELADRVLYRLRGWAIAPSKKNRVDVREEGIPRPLAIDKTSTESGLVTAAESGDAGWAEV